MGTWIIWLIVAAVLGVAEVMTATLAFGLGRTSSTRDFMGSPPHLAMPVQP